VSLNLAHPVVITSAGAATLEQPEINLNLNLIRFS